MGYGLGYKGVGAGCAEYHGWCIGMVWDTRVYGIYFWIDGVWIGIQGCRGRVCRVSWMVYWYGLGYKSVRNIVLDRWGMDWDTRV